MNPTVHKNRRHRWLAIAALLVGLSARLSALPIITSVVETGGDDSANTGAQFTGQTFNHPNLGADLTLGTFVEEAPAYRDRVHQWNGATDLLPLPDYLVGGEYIMIRNDNRDNASFQLSVTVAQPAVVYVLVDNRLTDGSAGDPPESGLPLEAWARMQWLHLDGFQPVQNGLNRLGDPSLPDEVGVDENADGVGPGGSIQNFSSVYSRTVQAGTFTLGEMGEGGRNMYGVVVKLQPGTVNSPPEIKNITPANNTLFSSASSGFSFTATTVAPNSLATAGVKLALNGQDVSASLTVGGTSTSRTVSYGQLQPNTLYRATIVVSDQAGRATTNSLTFDTFVANSAVTIEAEDYNYGGGQFVTSAAPGGYQGRPATRGIDYHNNNGTVLATVYRADNYVALAQSTDVTRASFSSAGATDYQVGSLQAGDWLNYTRPLDGHYHVYLRAATGVAQAARLDRVSGATTTDQSVSALGTFLFRGPAGTAPFDYAPLTDAFGHLASVRLAGNSTLRITALNANLNLTLNYLLLVPATGDLGPAYVSVAQPLPGTLDVAPDARVAATLTKGATEIANSTVKMKLNGAEVTPTVTPTADGLVAAYQPSSFLALNTENTVSLTYTDSAGASTTSEWSFRTVASVTTLPANFATPAGSGQGSGLRVKMRKAPDTDAFGVAFTLANTSARANQHLADQLIDPDWGVPYANEAAGPSGDGVANRSVINFDQFANPVGFFAADQAFPNLSPDPNAYYDPAQGPNNISMEVTAYLELSAGFHRLGVRSDDGFLLTSGPTLAEATLVLGTYEGGRGSGLPGGATEFEFFAEASGVYPIRLIYYEGNGGANIEFYAVDRETFQRVLINDATQPGAIKAYLNRAVQIYTPVVAITSPVNDTILPNHPADVTVTATASVINSRIEQVEFFVGGTRKIGETSTSPYTIVWSQAPAGRYRLTAKATDANGLSTVSAPIDIIVGRPLIVEVVEIGGDAEPTDTVLATWTGQTFSNGVSGEFLEPFKVPAFGEDVPAMVDRTHQWNSATPTVLIPDYLLGAEYIMSGNDNRDNIPYELVITLSESAYVYLLIDDRMGDGNNADPPNYPDWQGDRNGDGLPDMGWVKEQGWQPVTNGLNRFNNPAWPDQVGMDEGGDGVGPGVGINQWSSIYVKQFPAGSASILEPDNPGQNMYGVVVSRLGPVILKQPEIASPKVQDNKITITWTGGGTLEATDNLLKPNWQAVGTGGSFTEPIGTGAKFYRVKR
jgi:hypothetical protein